jgi:hypothetical protein
VHGNIISASSTTKTGRHDTAEILLKVALNTKNQIKSYQIKSLFILNIHQTIKTYLAFQSFDFERT